MSAISMPKTLSETFLKNLEPQEKEIILPVDQSLFFVVSPKGKKSWRIRYTLATGE